MLPTEHLPLQGRVTVYWDEHQIPFIDAETDDDAAFALGLVHAHLRLGQMAIYRRIAQGRIAEMGGPLAIDIDHGIRILDFGRAAPAMPGGDAGGDAALAAAVRRRRQPLPGDREAAALRIRGSSGSSASRGPSRTYSPSAGWPAPTSPGSSGSTS